MAELTTFDDTDNVAVKEIEHCFIKCTYCDAEYATVEDLEDHQLQDHRDVLLKSIAGIESDGFKMQVTVIENQIYADNVKQQIVKNDLKTTEMNPEINVKNNCLCCFWPKRSTIEDCNDPADDNQHQPLEGASTDKRKKKSWLERFKIRR